MPRILGIDPGSQNAGFGIIDVVGGKFHYVAHGTLRLNAGASLEKRLVQLHRELAEMIREMKPDCAALERVFFAKNAHSALQLGQARGVALLALAAAELPIAEYAATEVKQSLTGKGNSKKDQVAKMVDLLLKSTGKEITHETHDASDALALAICHAMRGVKLAAPRGAAPAFSGVKAQPRRRISLAQALRHRIEAK